MDILAAARELREAADLVVTDEEGRSVLLVEVKSEVGDESSELARLREHQERFGFPFAMLANPERILLLGAGELSSPAQPVAELSSPETLRAYRSRFADPQLRSKDDILASLGRWLDASTGEFLTDRHEGYCCLKKSGLAERLVWGRVLGRGELFGAAGEAEFLR